MKPLGHAGARGSHVEFRDTTPRTVLVTGATGTLGRTVTRRLLEDGNRVAATWQNQDKAQSLADELHAFHERLTLVEADVTDPQSVATAVQRTETQLGTVEALVHLVGGWEGGAPIHEHPLEVWDRMMDLNLHSAFICCRVALPGMYALNWGRVVLVSSRAARQERDNQGAYAVAKAGVSVLAETIAEESRGTNVTANVIAPSILDTPGNRAAIPDADRSKWVPLEDVAATVAFLISEQAGELRGAWLPLFGSA
ncbi:MAG: SDR family oxidoreductase [Nitriliruptorales bacterium]